MTDFLGQIKNLLYLLYPCRLSSISVVKKGSLMPRTMWRMGETNGRCNSKPAKCSSNASLTFSTDKLRKEKTELEEEW